MLQYKGPTNPIFFSAAADRALGVVGQRISCTVKESDTIIAKTWILENTAQATTKTFFFDPCCAHHDDSSSHCIFFAL